MAYIQKGNPFKQKTSTVATSDISQSDMDIAQRINKMRFEMGQTYPIVSEEQIRKDVAKGYEFNPRFYAENKRWVRGEMKRLCLSYKEWKKQKIEESVQFKLDDTAQSKEERKELYAQDPSGKGYDIDKSLASCNPKSHDKLNRGTTIFKVVV